MTDAELRVVRKAARQAVRFEEWHFATARERKEAFHAHGHRRAAEVFARDNPRPRAPRPPEFQTDEFSTKDAKYVAWMGQEEYQEYLKLAAAWGVEHRRLGRDMRRVPGPEKSLVLPDGLYERRRRPFAEPTAEAVVDELTGSDTRWWARLAAAALDKAQDPKFRKRAGRPETVSERESR